MILLVEQDAILLYITYFVATTDLRSTLNILAPDTLDLRPATGHRTL